jgi:hypothetical protein
VYRQPAVKADSNATRADRGGQHGWRAALADPALAAPGLYALVAVGAVLAAYFAIFAYFAPYDDEGTSLVRLLSFVEGDALYRDIWSAYGPFYFELFGGFFEAFGLSVDTNSGRTVVIVVWVLSSFLLGLSSQRLTGNLLLGATAMIASFGILGVLVNEPMHPLGLSALLLSFFTLLAVTGLGGRVVWVAIACGATLAALTLTKVNLGCLAVAAVALAAVLTVEPLQRRRWVRWPTIAAFLFMPVCIMARDLGADWVRDLVLLEALGATAVIVAAWPLRPRGGEDHSELVRWLLGAAGGFALAALAILAAVLLTGPTPAEVYNGVIQQAIGIRDVLLLRLPFPRSAVDWGVAAVAAAALSIPLRSAARGGAHSPWPGLLRAVAGLAIWYSAARAAPVVLGPSAENPAVIPLMLAWVATIPPAGADETPYKRFLRVLLPLFAVAQTLQVYPVAGSQTGLAAVTYIAVGALCLGDALTSLRTWAASRGPEALRRFGTVATILTLALFAQLGLDKIVRPGITAAAAYRALTPLPFKGATLVRLSEGEVETYVSLVDLLQRYDCTTFIGYPNINSLYIWSGIDPPPPSSPGGWLNAVDPEQQQRTVDAMRASPRPCAIRSDERAEFWLHGEPPPDTPLVRYIFDDFVSVHQVDNFDFLLPRQRVAGARQ